MASLTFVRRVNYKIMYNFLNSFIGKFFVIASIWSFIFHSLSELRHLFWDMGYGFELKTANFTGLLVIFLSIVLQYFFIF